VAQEKSKVFLREATGLVKNVSILDVISINVSDMSAGAALASVGFTTILLPTMAGVNIVYASLIAFVLMIPQYVIYTMMTRRIPRTGGDYVWTSRTLGGFAGNVLALIGYTFGNLPYASLIALTAVFAIGSTGVALGNSNLLGLALPGNIAGANTILQFAVAAIILVVIVGINIVKPNVGFKLITLFTIIGVLSVLVAISVLLSAGKPGIVNFMNSLGNSSLSYTSVASSYSGGVFNLSATLLFVPFFAFFTYPWVNAGPAIASELRGKSALRWNVPVSAIIAFILVTAPLATMYYVGGLEFTNGAFSNPNLVNNFSFNFFTLAMGVSTSPTVQWFIGIGWILWIVTILAYLIIVEARYLLAQAFDRFLPSQVAHVSPRFGSPVTAYVIDFAIILGMLAGASFLYGTWISLYGTIVGPMVYFMFVGIAAAYYAIKHEKGSAKGILVTSGILSAIVFLFLTYEFLVNWQIWGGNLLAYGFVVVTAIGGGGIYIISKSYHAKRGVDISLAFKEIPPE
jgi:amino acid transporter